MQAPAVYSKSQQASAEAHLAEAHTWQYFWSPDQATGIRYLNIKSATSGKIYTARADGQGCNCPQYQHRGACSHMLAIQLVNEAEAQAAEDEDARLGLASEAEVEMAFADLVLCRSCGVRTQGSTYCSLCRERLLGYEED